ncbi:hypothetical protein GCM10020000_73880 [Streptomyces olivoverticillatus]
MPSEAFLAQLRQQFPEGAHELGGGAHPLVEPGQAGGEVAAAAEHHAGAGGVGRQRAACVRDGGGGRVQGDQLVRFGGGDRLRHDPEGGRVEGDDVVDESAAAAVDRVGPVAVGVPASGRHVGDGVHAVREVAPVGVEVAGAGQGDGHPDDGDGLRPHRRRHQPEAV